MKFLSRALSVLILVLTVLTTVVLVLFIVEKPQVAQPAAPTNPTTTEERVSVGTFAKAILTRLPLIPTRTKDASLIGVIIENHEDARPHHKGLDHALLVQEFFVEGYISRFLVTFDIESLPTNIGPVRSLRPYFVDGALPWVRTFFHAGGSPEALQRVQDGPYIRSFNGLGLPDHFLREDALPAPHNLFLSKENAESLLADVSVKETTWPPYTTGKNPSSIKADDVFINFYNPDHNVRYTYDDWSGAYERTNGTEISEARPTNIVVLEMPVDSIVEFGRLVIDVSGQGKVALFRNGTIQQGTWKKEDSETAFTFEDQNGEPLVFSQGLTWMMVVTTFDRLEWSDSSTAEGSA